MKTSPQRRRPGWQREGPSPALTATLVLAALLAAASLPFRAAHAQSGEAAPESATDSSAADPKTLAIEIAAGAADAVRTARAEEEAALIGLSADLDRVLNGELAEDEMVQGYFAVEIADVDAVSARVGELGAEVEASTARLAELRAARRALEGEGSEDPQPAASDSDASLEAAEALPETSVAPQPVAEEAEPETAAELAAAEAERVRIEAERLRLEVEARASAEAARAEWSQRALERLRRREDLEAQLASEQLRLAVAQKRFEYLQALEERFDRMTDASRRILPSLVEERVGLRKRAARLSELGGAVRAAGDRNRALSGRSSAGMLVGFVSEQRLLAEEFATSAASYAKRAERFDSLSAKLTVLAESLEREGRAVRSALLRSTPVAGGQAAIDELFLFHLKAKRRIRKDVSEVLTASSEDELAELETDIDALASAPWQIGTASEGREVLEDGLRYRLRIDALLAAEAASLRAWELAFENELVTVLSEQASSGARTTAYRFSGELVDDVTSEVELAWQRMLEGWRTRESEVPSLSALATTPAGQDYLMRIAAALAILVGGLLLRRQTPRLTVLLVKSLVRVPSLRPRVGLLVRSSGLVQSVLPVLVGIFGFWLLLFVVRDDGIAGPLVRVVAFPVLIYLLGRQLVIGATKRITPARPALVELRPATLEKLQRTYATLGIVVTLAYILDGLARLIIGAGRVVSLIDGFVILWVFVWGAWETLRWRADLAGSWASVVSEADPEPRERRLALWMERSRLGFVLSPFALLRVALTPTAAFVRSLATGTDLVQSIRARLLRRRSTQAEPGAEKSTSDLPDEYLEAFPLYPILGEDDSLLVPREEILDQILEQWKRWRETRKEGSLVLVGEKGAGKTTLAAQLSRRANGVTLTQHTLRGKPTTRDELVALVAEEVGAAHTRDLDELVKWICEGDERIVLLDEAHNVFLRHVDGYGAYDALVELVNATSSKVFWVLVFNSFTWQFLNESRGRVHYFRKLLYVPKWTPDEIQQLIRLRNRKTKFDLRFDEVLLSDEKANSDSLELVEEADGYFRLLWESSGGNPRIATGLWLSSLRPVGENVLSVGLFPEANTEALSGLQDDLVFALAAICQHENLSTPELARVLNLSEGFARFATRYLSESGFLEAKDESGDRFTLAPTHYRAVLRILRSRHLLYE